MGEEDNKKRLNNAKNIIRQQRIITNEDALNLGVVVLFAPTHNACKVTGDVVGLYNEIVDQLSCKMELTLYIVICAMIDAYCDDEQEYGRLMDMMNEKTSVETVERFESLGLFKNRVSELEKANDVANGQIHDLEKANDVANGQIHDLEKANAKANHEIRVLKAQVEDLKSQLNNK